MQRRSISTDRNGGHIRGITRGGRLSPALLGLVALLAAVPAYGNGGPVAWTEAGATGGVTPLAVDGVRLVRERLFLRVSETGDQVAARARYVLENRGDRRAVEFGVPVFWYGAPGDEGAAVEPPPSSARAMMRSVRVQVGTAAPRGCRFVPWSRLPVGVERERRTLPLVNGFCVTRITLPAHQRVELGLKYQSQMVFEDIETSKSAQTYFDLRTLLYHVAPAGGWEGPVERLHVEVELGRWADGVRELAPDGWKREGTRRVLTLGDVDLAKMAPLRIAVDQQRFREHRQLVAWGARYLLKGSLSATSEFVPGAARRLVDGRPDTVWCVPRGGSGEPARVTLRFRTENDFCRLEAFALAAGAVASEASYRAHGRPTRVRFSSCEHPGVGFDFAVPSVPRHDESAAAVPAGLLEIALSASRTDGGAPGQGEGCLQLEILESEPGETHDDACITEFVPIVNCG